MSKNKWLASIFGCILICILAIAAISVSLIAWNAFLPPKYSMDQVDSEHEGYRRSTLTSGNIVYVNDYEEYALATFGPQPTQMIGRLPVSEYADSGVYAIPSQDPSAYVLEYDPMYQVVYRNINHPPFDWRTAEFQSMRLLLPSSPIETTDPLLIEDVTNALKGEITFELMMQPYGDYVGFQNYSLCLFSDEIPGLMYIIGVHVDTNGQVYLAENAVANQWVDAGALFSEWMK